MNTVVDNAVCRCCSSEGAFKNIKGKYIWMGEEETYIDMLKDCYDIQIIIPEKLNHDLESGICELCITQLRNALNFRKQVLTTEEVFRKRFSDKIQLCESNCIKIEEPSDGLHDDDDGVVDALDFDINVSEVHEYEVPVKEEESEGEVSRSKRSKRTTRSSTIKIKRSKLDRAETSKCDSKKNDEKLQQKVKHLIKKKSKIKSEQDDDWTVSISKKADSDQGEQSGSLVGTVVKFLKPTKGELKRTKIKKNQAPTSISHENVKTKDIKYDVVKMRTNVKMILLNSNATPIGHFSDAGYGCAFCYQCHLLPADLKTHTLTSHSYEDIQNFKKDRSPSAFLVKMDITDLKCTICDTETVTLENLMDHLKNVHAKEIHLDVKHQMVPFKFEDECLRCYICRQVFSTFKTLHVHMSTHYRNYVCDICEAGFLTRQNLQSHMFRHKTGTYPCEICGKVFNHLSRKQAHTYQVHVLGNLVSKCGYCNEKFHNYIQKNNHLAKVHGIVKAVNKCYACDKVLANRKCLTAHIKRYHLKEKKHKCTRCDKSFFLPGQLREHTLVHTGGARKFQCDVCFKMYGRKTTLREHMRIHNNDRRFKCEHCGVGFVQKCSWKNHVKSKHYEIVT